MAQSKFISSIEYFHVNKFFSWDVCWVGWHARILSTCTACMILGLFSLLHVHTYTYTTEHQYDTCFVPPPPECSEGCPVVRDTRPLPTHRAVHTDHCSGQELQTSVPHPVRTEVLQWSQGESRVMKTIVSLFRAV